jgi:hypothetical protein
LDIPDPRRPYLAFPIIPVVDFDRLRAEYDQLIDQITEEEADRNGHDKPLLFDGPGSYQEIDISSGPPFEPIDKTDRLPACIPTIENFDIEVEEACVNVHVFEFSSRLPSIVIKVKQPPAWNQVEDIASVLNTDILVGWPYLRPGLLIGATDEANTITKDGKITRRSRSGHLNDIKYLERFATILDPVHMTLQYLGKQQDGSYDRKVEEIPAQLCAPIDFSNAPLLFRPLEDRTPLPGETLVFCGGMPEGFIGKLMDHIKPDNRHIKVVVNQRSHPTGVIPIVRRDNTNWVKAEAFVKAIGGISYGGLRVAMTSVIVVPHNVNIAFALYRSDRMVIEGACKRLGKDRVFADFLVPLMVQYFTKTGNLKQLIMGSGQKGDDKVSFTLEQLYGGTPEFQAKKFGELVQWMLENAPAAKSGIMNENGDFLSDKVLKEIEKVVDQFKAQIVDKVIDDFDQKNALWNGKRRTKFMELPALGKRVISVAPGTFGEFGTVIQIDRDIETVTVMFDNVLKYGTRLEGRLSTNRGLRLRLNELVGVPGA